VGSNTVREHGCLPLVGVVCCQVEVSVSRRSLVQRSSTDCDVSNECDRETPTREILAQNRVEAPQGKKKKILYPVRGTHNITLFSVIGDWFEVIIHSFM
jgi:hypothetical protein